MLDNILYYLEVLRFQLCGPVPVNYEPGLLDYAVVTIIVLSIVVGLIWFVRALFVRDSPKIQAIKAQVLED